MIRRWVPELEQNMLWEHTEKVREGRKQNQKKLLPQEEADKLVDEFLKTLGKPCGGEAVDLGVESRESST